MIRWNKGRWSNSSSASLLTTFTSASFSYRQHSLVFNDILQSILVLSRWECWAAPFPPPCFPLPSLTMFATHPTRCVQDRLSSFYLSSASTDFYISPFLPVLTSLLSSQLHSRPFISVPHPLFSSPIFSTIISSYENFMRDFFPSIFLSIINPVHGDFLELSRNLVIYGKQMNGVCFKWSWRKL